MNEDFLRVRNGFFENRLLLNPDNTKLIVFGSRQITSKQHESHLSLLGMDISLVQSAKDVGIILDPLYPYNDRSVGMYRTSSAK